MKATYNNRYGDTIIFEELQNEVHMSGFNLEWMRYGYDDDYSEAYELYLLHCKALEEPDYNFLIDDPDQNRIRVMTYQEFANALRDSRVVKDPLYKYWRYVRTDYNNINMVDPSGGPYIHIGADIGVYFGDKKKRILNSIQILKDKVIFKIN